MPLTPLEKTTFALWVAAARYLDPTCCGADDPTDRKILDAARACLYADAKGAELAVNSDETAARHLQAAADKLDGLISAYPISPSIADLQATQALLRESALCVATCGSCDGIAVHKPGRDPLGSCGLLPLAAIVETRIRRLIESVSALSFEDAFAIQYVTGLTEDNSTFAPFRVNGEANIGRSPRTVTVVLKVAGMSSRDLWHVAYTLHHELVCHAFQAAFANEVPANAHPRCYWSEGWMDTVSFDLVWEWVDDADVPSKWLPLKGEEAKGEIRRFHDSRYTEPPGLSPDDTMRRQRARAAYRQLEKTLLESRMAASKEEAAQFARRFALVANVHPEANSRRLKDLASRLRDTLLSVARPEAGLSAAQACLAFCADRNLAKLETVLKSLTN
jgi:hypothetical protein